MVKLPHKRDITGLMFFDGPKWSIKRHEVEGPSKNLRFLGQTKDMMFLGPSKNKRFQEGKGPSKR